jgi:hypothetical protein
VSSVPVCMCTCKVPGTLKDNCGVNASVYVVQFNGFMSLNYMLSIDINITETTYSSQF